MIWEYPHGNLHMVTSKIDGDHCDSYADVVDVFHGSAWNEVILDNGI